MGSLSVWWHRHQLSLDYSSHIICPHKILWITFGQNPLDHTKFGGVRINDVGLICKSKFFEKFKMAENPIWRNLMAMSTFKLKWPKEQKKKKAKMYPEMWPVGIVTEMDGLTLNLMPGYFGLTSQCTIFCQNSPRSSMGCMYVTITTTTTTTMKATYAMYVMVLFCFLNVSPNTKTD